MTQTSYAQLYSTFAEKQKNLVEEQEFNDIQSAINLVADKLKKIISENKKVTKVQIDVTSTIKSTQLLLKLEQQLNTLGIKCNYHQCEPDRYDLDDVTTFYINILF